MQTLSPTHALQKLDAVSRRNLFKTGPITKSVCRAGLVLFLAALLSPAAAWAGFPCTVAPTGAIIPFNNYWCRNQAGQCVQPWCDADTNIWDTITLRLRPNFVPGPYQVTARDQFGCFNSWVVRYNVAADGSYTREDQHWPYAEWGGNAEGYGWEVYRFPNNDAYATVVADAFRFAGTVCGTAVSRHGSVLVTIGPAPAPDENQTKKCDLTTSECSGPGCSGGPMAKYSIHLMLASLHIEDTPISYNSPRGPSTDFKVVYNQREANQPATFDYSNLGPKWTFNWLSYVTDNGPATPPATPSVYVRSGGTERFSGFDSGTNSYLPDKQSLAVLVWMGDGTYEKRFPDGSKEVFTKSVNGTPRRVFLTSVVDAAGNSTTLQYDKFLRITSITDSLGQSTSLEYDQNDVRKIKTVTDPFGRAAHFEYQGDNGQLSKITDPIGIESQFVYEPGTNFIKEMTTPYGTTQFTKGEVADSLRWLEATDPLGGKERVEYNAWALDYPSSETSAPSGADNNNLHFQNTFYWDKMAMSQAPGDYSKAQVFHWLLTADGKVSGIKHSEKKALESRIWYTYENQTDPVKVGKNALPITIARLITGGATELSQYSFNALGNQRSETDPAGRVRSYLYAANNTDVLAVYQRNPAGSSVDPFGQNADKMAAYTYNSLHKPLTETDAAGQVTTYTYNNSGQILTRENAKHEITTYVYGDGGSTTPPGYLEAIISPPFNGTSAITSFSYDRANRVQTVTNVADQYTVTTDYDAIDRKTLVTYPDGTSEAFQYTDNLTGAMTLDLTGSRDRLGRWTYRHYNANRQMDSITDPLGRTTQYNWCTCGSLTSQTDPNGNFTMFNRDLQGRVYQRYNTDTTTITYLFEGQTQPETVGLTSRLVSSTVGTGVSGRQTNYSYEVDGNISSITYTDTPSATPSPPTPPVSFTYDPYHNRALTMTDSTGQSTYDYNPIPAAPTLGAGRLNTIDGSLDDDTITFGYDELGRVINEGIQGGEDSVVHYDSLGRLSWTENALGHFDHTYDGVTPRLTQTVAQTIGQTTNYTYFGNNQNRRLQTLENLDTGGGNLSKFDYTYNAEGQIMSWNRQLGTTTSGRWFDYDDARQLLSARNASNPSFATEKSGYSYDYAGNRISDSNFNPNGPRGNGTFHDYTPNEVNQIDTFSTVQGGFSTLPVDMTYDLAGNLIDDGEGKTFEWDAASRLVAINHGNERSEFTYDGVGRRVKIVEKTGSTVKSGKQFVWVGYRIAQERGLRNDITRRYFAEGEYRDKPFYYTRDHLGSIRELTNADGKLEARYDYDSYGKRTKLDGSGDADFGYTGHYHHAPSGLILTLYRAYNPAMGRWISKDPIGENGGINLYGYVMNDPANQTDPLGLFPPSHPFCKALAETIENIQKRIRKRLSDFREDPLGLPWRAPGDVGHPSLSRWGHEKLINQDKALLAARVAEYAAMCNDDDPPSCPAARPEPLPAPPGGGGSPDFMQTMSNITGLSGGALLTYVIISEGSRVVFPPRNLVPVP